MFMNWFRNKYPYTDFHELNFDVFITEFKSFIEALGKLDSWVDTHEEEYKELKKIVDDLYDGSLTPALEESLKKWVDANLESLIGDAIKHVYFGLTNDGYFCAYIPDNWSDIQFDTVNDYDDPLYGHLMLMYD